MTEVKKRKKKVFYSLEIVESICEMIENSDFGIRKILASSPDFPSMSEFYKWLKEHEEARELYEEAKQFQIRNLAEDLLEIADEPVKHFYKDEQYNCTRVDSAVVNLSRARVDARKWLLSKLNPKVYGDKISQEITGKDGGAIKHAGFVAVVPAEAESIEEWYNSICDDEE